MTKKINSIQKQSSRGVLRKRCSENMHGCSPVNLLYILRTPFPKNTSGWLLLGIYRKSISIHFTCEKVMKYGSKSFDEFIKAAATNFFSSRE